MDDLRLIELVRSRPVIYNKSHKDYKNPVKKAEAWNEIAQELGGIASSKCYKRWSTLRERYTLDIRKHNKKDPDGTPIAFREWTYYPIIHSFLGKFYAPRRSYHAERKNENPVPLNMEEMEEMAEMEDMAVVWNESEDLIDIPKTTVPPQAAAVSAMLSSLPQPYLGAAVEKVMPIILDYARMSRLRLPLIDSD